MTNIEITISQCLIYREKKIENTILGMKFRAIAFKLHTPYYYI